MAKIQVLSIELDNHQGSLRHWEETLLALGDRISPSLRDQTMICCLPSVGQGFSGRVEFGGLGETILYKLIATPLHFTSSLRTVKPTQSLPVLLFAAVNGSCRFAQHNHCCILHPGDWCVIDTRLSYEGWPLTTDTEILILGLEQPSDQEVGRQLEQGLARRCDGRTGMSRVLQATWTEAFRQMSRLAPSCGRSLQSAVTAIAWDALHEQLEAPPPGVHRDTHYARLKGYIESQITDPDLSVNSIAEACGMSVRSVHRAFAADPAGSVSKYIWIRRLNHCAATLRDRRQAHRPITEICLSWGFSSTSHFSRLFKNEFGVPPRNYRKL
jgi:AraC family transcriptional regulator, positive regulator of tynA and feaB